MIVRVFLTIVLLLTAPLAPATGVYDPIPEGHGRITVERSTEALLYRQDALIEVNGRGIGRLSSGKSLSIDVPAGQWRIGAATRSIAERSLLQIALPAGKEIRVRVGLDPARFPADGGVSGLSNLLRQSLDAPNDDRLPLFRLIALPADSVAPR